MGRLQKKRKSGGKRKRNATHGSVVTVDRTAADKGSSSGPDLSRDSKALTSPPKKKSVTRSASKGRRKNYVEIAVQFLREVVVELKKVTWPSRKQTTGSTAVMIILVAIISIFLGTVDIGLSRLVQVILQ